MRVGDGTAQVRIPVRPDFFHAANAVHGSVYFKALDDATFFAASSLVHDAFVLTVTFHLTLLRPVTAGTLVATGQVVHRSKRLIIADGAAIDDRGKIVARGTGSFMPSTTPLSADIGYR
ncbi:MAG TPA: PaaI family thioesterase [Gemmatimonadaceae bacterium]|nr:PaaI family thioesterase [Gemmatimonadaceae bacterium]